MHIHISKCCFYVCVFSGSQHLFSLLSVTSHSSLSLHKLTLLVYNSNYPYPNNTVTTAPI